MKGTQIVVADEHVLFRAGLRKLLDKQPGMRVVGEASAGDQAIRVVQKLRPQVLLLDIDIKNPSATDVLKKLGPMSETRTLLIAGKIENSKILIENSRILVENSRILDALNLNARGLLLKDSTALTLYQSIRAVMSGQYWVFCTSVPDVDQALKPLEGPDALPLVRSSRLKLTAREQEILKAVVLGANNREIGEQFLISEQTVKHHVTNIFNKTGASNRLELALFAVDHRLVETSSETRTQRRLRFTN